MDWVRAIRDKNEPDIVVAVAQKFPENIDGHDPESALGLDFENREYCLVKDRVSDVLRGFCIGSDLSEKKTENRSTRRNRRRNSW